MFLQHKQCKLRGVSRAVVNKKERIDLHWFWPAGISSVISN